LSRELQIEYAVVGVPRYFRDVLPRLLRTMQKAGANAPAGFFWKYLDADMPQTNQGRHPVPISESDWSDLQAFDFATVQISEPLGEPAIRSALTVHPQVQQLGLKPNPAASFSWLTALARGASMLVDKDPKAEADLWVILRPDLRLSASAMRRVVRSLSTSQIWDKTTVAVAARASAHRVLNVNHEKRNLPIDHFFIGSPQAIRNFCKLPELLDQIAAGLDLRQPLVNEFVVGQLLEDNGLRSYPIRLGYTIWRGSWFRSVFSASGRKGVSLAIAGAKNLLWNIRGLLSPGFHKKSV